eukprot:scaffold319_cov244-Pinguiococcus_pyrenoidosus.AAC.6
MNATEGQNLRLELTPWLHFVQFYEVMSEQKRLRSGHRVKSRPRVVQKRHEIFRKRHGAECGALGRGAQNAARRSGRVPSYGEIVSNILF